MLEIKNLTKTYNVGGNVFCALNDVSLSVSAGQIFGVIGLSGAGKTSLARCVSALEVPDAGDIIVDKANITKLRGAALRRARRNMGLVFQHFNLLMNSDVETNVAFPLRIAGKKKAETRARVAELLEIVGLSDKTHAYPATLSGGQKQRVCIARALATKPGLVICDEATSALDPDTTRGVLALIKDIGAKMDVTFLVITHEMDVIKEICTHVAIMEGGEIIENAPVLDVLTSPKTDTAKRFFTKVEAYPKPAPGGRIFKATFIGDAARRGYINEVSLKTKAGLSILSGNIQSVSGVMVGQLVLEISGEAEHIAHALKYLRENGVGIEEVLDV